MIDTDNLKKLLGALPSPYDARDWPATRAPLALIPEVIRLKLPPVVSQGAVGNCVMQASRMAAILGVPVVVFVTDVVSAFIDAWGVWSNEGPVIGSHLVMIAGAEPHTTYNGKLNMAYVRNSWGEDWALAGYCYMTWEDVFRRGEVWAIYPPKNGKVNAGVDFGYGTWRNHDGPGMYTREALKGYSEMGIAPLSVDPDNTEVPDVIHYAQITDKARLVKAAAPYAGATYYRLSTPEDVRAVLYEAMLMQEGKKDEEDDKVVVKHTTLRLKDPYMRDKDTVTGKDVTTCQKRLIYHGYSVGIADGVFGPKCDSATRSFQKAKGLTVDGIVGIKSWAALEKDDKEVNNLYDIPKIESMMDGMVGDEYLIGGQNDQLTKKLLDDTRAAKPSYFDNTRYNYLLEKINLAEQMNRRIYCEDCSGLLMACNDVLGFWPKKDLSAASIYEKCTPIKRENLRPGDILFRRDETGKIDHMAWAGTKGIYEAAGIAYGVVFRMGTDDRTTLNKITGRMVTLEKWTEYGRPLVSL